jgi:hypothetical protein
MSESDRELPHPTLSRAEIAFILRQPKRRPIPKMMRELAWLDEQHLVERIRALSTIRPSERD